MIGVGTIGFLLRSRYFTNSSTPPLYIIASRFSTAWRMSDKHDIDAGIQERELAQAMLQRREVVFDHGEGLGGGEKRHPRCRACRWRRQPTLSGAHPRRHGRIR